jgi:hypothetical protein
MEELGDHNPPRFDPGTLATLGATTRTAIETMSSVYDQQPIQRTVGRRQSRDGRAPSALDRAAMTRLAQYRTRVPKGTFIYYSAQEMNADRDQWTVAAILAKAR